MIELTATQVVSLVLVVAVVGFARWCAHSVAQMPRREREERERDTEANGHWW